MTDLSHLKASVKKKKKKITLKKEKEKKIVVLSKSTLNWQRLENLFNPSDLIQKLRERERERESVCYVPYGIYFRNMLFHLQATIYDLQGHYQQQ